jgi:hypothetical protein
MNEEFLITVKERNSKIEQIFGAVKKSQKLSVHRSDWNFTTVAPTSPSTSASTHHPQKCQKSPNNLKKRRRSNQSQLQVPPNLFFPH